MAKPTEPKTRSIEKKLEINAPREAVWKALTDATELTRWFPPDARVTPGAGGSIWWSWGEGFEWQSRIEVWDPGHHLWATYTSPPASEQETDASRPIVMDFHLETRGGKTVLRLVHSGFGLDPSWDEEYDGVRRGWSYELRSLRHYLEYHRGTPRLIASVRVAITTSMEEAWGRLLSPQGFLQQGTLENLHEGHRYSIVAATGDTFEGTVQVFGPPKDFCGTAENLNNSLLRIHLEDWKGQRHVWVWLSAYGLPQKDVDALQQRWEKQLGKLFPQGETPA